MPDETTRPVAVITGGAQGIGFAAARRLAGTHALALWDSDAAMLAAAADVLSTETQVHAAPVDITDEAGITAATVSTEAALGPIAVLVHSAGIAGANASVISYPVAEWRRIIDIDLTGTFLVNRSVAARMVAHGYGRIVNIASIAGKEGNPNACAYSAAKAGVIALTKSLGKELACHDIAVNCITPAAARTRIFDQMSDEHIAYMLSKIPRARFLEVEEAANMIAWLAGQENSFATGAVFDLSGGRATY